MNLALIPPSRKPPPKRIIAVACAFFADGQLVVDCGQLAFDIIQKSQEPTSYVLFLLNVSPACWVLLPALPPAYCDT